jgi:hypothetical protein
MAIDIMGLFGFLKKRPQQRGPVARPAADDPVLIELRIPKVNDPPLTPEVLRKQLFDAAATGDNQKLCQLCRQHENSIFKQGLIWSKVPPEIRASPRLLHWYANGLKAIARVCADHLGKPELMNQIRDIEGLPGPKQKAPKSTK